jgi:GNAT superfamily N-acetyltransferase
LHFAPNTAFGSTYTREIAFTDDDWRRRLNKPIAKTFVAVRLHDRRILSATSLFGPMPTSEPLSNPSAVTTTASDDGRLEGKDTPLYFQLTGVYTRAEARGQGLAQAVAKTAIERAGDEARRQGREYKLAIDVYASNTAAIAFYKKCGFVAGGPRPVDSDTDPSRPELLMYYHHGSSPL